MGWGYSECAWVFNPSGPPIGKTLDQMTRNFHAQLSEEFASHDCAEHPWVKWATPSSRLPSSVQRMLDLMPEHLQWPDPIWGDILFD
jgi:hypothetical protein